MRKKQRSALRGALTAIVLSAMALSCELSSGFLSESERSALFSVRLNANVRSEDAVLENGSYIDAGSSLAVTVSKLSGAGEVAYLDLSIEGTTIGQHLAGPAARSLGRSEGAGAQAPDSAPNPVQPPDGEAGEGGEGGGDAAETAAAEGEGSSAGLETGKEAAVVSPETGSAALSVEQIEGTLPPVILPADLEPGAYRLSVRLTSPEGKTLQQLSIVAFIGLAEPLIDSVSVYPPSVEPGQALLLGVTLDEPAGDPWLRWSRDGATFAEGSLSEGADRVVWTAPRVEGAYPLTVEAFPAAPPGELGFSFRANSRRELKTMVKATAGGSSDEFADPLVYLSLLRLDGSFEDMGLRSREAQPESFGAPSIEVYPGGFGYLLGEEAGVSMPGLMPPASQDRSAPFSVVMRLAPAARTGRLVSFAADDASYTLALGLEDGRPYVSLRLGEEEEIRSLAVKALPSLPGTIVATIWPSEAESLVSWNFEGERFDASPLPPLPAPPKGGALLGGQGSLPAVYDAFGMMSPSGPSRPPAPPSYRLAARRKWKAGLVLAEGFEDGYLPASASIAGGASVSVGAVRLSGIASMSFAASLRPDRSFIVEAELGGDLPSVFLEIVGKSGEKLFSVGGDGELLDRSGKRLGSVAAPGGRLALLATPSRGSLLVSGPDGKNPIKVAAAAAEAPYTISFSRSRAEGGASLISVLARDATVPAAR